ncbi:hypothetical protein V6N13_147847 [Hibiscus sabdariffa]|uniref:Uncharacterized protein n=1 Tax=Hibiscus sabdariffa TaxID=183260 RepID=A0ABR2TX14_9ROSI
MNRVTDMLATLGRSQSMEGAVYVIPPSTMTIDAADDKSWWEDQLRAANSTINAVVELILKGDECVVAGGYKGGRP